MILSVIIVNYNVKFFLEQCLCSVEKALEIVGEAEILVVDNQSTDGSIDYLRPKFPGVQFISNPVNSGFGSANNKALGQARGKYVLFLNPDTIIPEDSLSRCIAFMEGAGCGVGGTGEREKAADPADVTGAEDRKAQPGALGVRMVDGSGRFLRESFRGFPTAWAAFCRLSGLAALFPRSRRLAGYYLGYLPEKGDHPAPVLSGAFFFTKREILEETGGFDERFFMYAEDIDLSYRIERAGYRNHYLGSVTIVHFKGESTRKDIRYIKLFYKAMSQFRHKHFRGGLQPLYNALLDMAIWSRAALVSLGRLTVARNGRRSGGRGDGAGGAGQEPGFIERGGWWLTGDPEGIAEVEGWKAGWRKPFTRGKEDAGGVILCQGSEFSFESLIGLMEEMAGAGKACMIHAAGSRSIVGSRTSEGKGEVVPL